MKKILLTLGLVGFLAAHSCKPNVKKENTTTATELTEVDQKEIEERRTALSKIVEEYKKIGVEINFENEISRKFADQYFKFKNEVLGVIADDSVPYAEIEKKNESFKEKLAELKDEMDENEFKKLSSWMVKIDEVEKKAMKRFQSK